MKRSKSPPPATESTLDLVVRGAKLVTSVGIVRADLAAAGGKIVRIAPAIEEPAGETIDATGRYVFPGIIDAHVHFNEPGRAEWEGLATGSAALAAGGGTCFFDMPLNSEPPVLDAAALREKRRLAEEKSCVDFALWGGLVPGNLDKLAGLHAAGAIGLKAFMCASGIDSFPRVDTKALHAGMKRAAKLGMIVAVHAEDDALAAKATAAAQAKRRRDARAFLDSRPVEVELAAIRVALELAGETGCALHVVHVSSPEGLALIDEARRQGVDVTAETCPHYLLLNDEDVIRLGAPANGAPPLRDEQHRRALWSDLRSSRIQTIGSDHSPAPPEMKTAEDFFSIWGGIGGVQHGFELLLSEVAGRREREHDFSILAGLFAVNVARRFGLEGQKGRLIVGHDADITIWDFDAPHEITADDLWTQHRISAYVGRRSRARATHTFVRGVPVRAEGRFTNLKTGGKFVRPAAD